MLRINLMLFMATVILALCVVAMQHQARTLYSELEQQQQLTKQYKTEFDQLQLEQSTWAMQARVEKLASENLRMHLPSKEQTKVVDIQY